MASWERVVTQDGIETIVSYPPFDGTEVEARAWLDWKIESHAAEKGWVIARDGDVATITKVYSLERTKQRVILIRSVA